MEKLATEGKIDLFYGDESAVSSQGYVPYGWQFPDEKVSVLVGKERYKINIFGLIDRNNNCHFATTQKNINANFVIEMLEKRSFSIKKETFIVLDNASIHTSKAFLARMRYWQERGLFIFFLPAYSPELNIAETMWRILKTKWIRPEDYLDKDTLFYAVDRCMNNIGKEINIKFSPFNNIN